MTNKGLISNIYKHLIKLNIKNISNLIKMDDQQTHEKMLSIANQQGNASQNHKKISPHTGQNSYH